MNSLTLDSLWADAVPTANEYSQLVTPQAIYFIHQLFKRNLSDDLNWFRPWIDTGGVSFPLLFRTFRALGVRYLGGYQEIPHVPGIEGLPFVSFPRRQPDHPPALWVMYEFPDVNVGDYSPTEVITAQSAADTIEALAAPRSFDFSRQVVLSTELRDRLVPARDMKLSVIRGGLHLSGRSDGTSLVLLPQQFSNCLRAHDASRASRARRSDLDRSDFLRDDRHRHLLRLWHLLARMPARRFRGHETAGAEGPQRVTIGIAAAHDRSGAGRRRAEYDERALNGIVNQKQVAIRTALEKRLDSLITPTARSESVATPAGRSSAWTDIAFLGSGACERPGLSPTCLDKYPLPPRRTPTCRHRAG